MDIVQVLTQQPNSTTARKYWNKLKERLKKEGSQLVTNCHQLKLPASDGKSYLTDAATAETLLRLVQSVPSPKAEPIKLWLAKVGYERMQETADPALSLNPGAPGSLVLELMLNRIGAMATGGILSLPGRQDANHTCASWFLRHAFACACRGQPSQANPLS
jgi:hypothetical protein